VLSGYKDSRAYAINQSGWVVGHSFTRITFRAFLWKAGTMRALNDLIPKHSGWDLTWATAVNSEGQIVGWGNFHGAERAFLLTPN
jgi:probable HAF family extracellular repeat protein